MPMINSFSLYPDDGTPSKGAVIPEEVKRQLLAAQLLQKQAADTSQPVYSKTLGLAKMLSGGLGGLLEGMTERRESGAQNQARQQQLDAVRALSGQQSMAPAAPPVPAPSAASPTMADQPSLDTSGLAALLLGKGGDSAPPVTPAMADGPPMQDAGTTPPVSPQASLDPQYLDQIKKFEGFAPRAQWDYKQYTNGFGTRAAAPNEAIDRPTADQRFNDEMGKAAAFVDTVAPNAPPGARAALASLTFNAGTKWADSGLGQMVKAGDWQGAQERILAYNKAGGQELPGLVSRRQAESGWFNAPPVTQGAPQGAPQGGPPASPPPMPPQQVAQASGAPGQPQGQPGFDAGRVQAIEQAFMNSRTDPKIRQFLMQQVMPDIETQKAPDGSVYYFDKRNPGAGMRRMPGQMPIEQFQQTTTNEGVAAQKNSITGKLETVPGKENSQSDVEYAMKNWQSLNLPDPRSPDPKTQMFWRDFSAKRLGGAGVNVTVDQKAETALETQRGTGLGKRLNDIADDGSNAAVDLQTIGRFRQLLGAVDPGTKTAALEGIRKATGIALDPNAPNVQAAGALVEYMVPRMRVAGSGTSSDRDMAAFRGSLPNLLGTPEGNTLVMDTMEGLAGYKKQRADIAAQWQTGDLSAKEAHKMMDALPDPFERFKAYANPQQPSSPRPNSQQPYSPLPSLDAIEREKRRRGLLP